MKTRLKILKSSLTAGLLTSELTSASARVGYDSAFKFLFFPLSPSFYGLASPPPPKHTWGVNHHTISLDSRLKMGQNI